jgi:hypothetical protein
MNAEEQGVMAQCSFENSDCYLASLFFTNFCGVHFSLESFIIQITTPPHTNSKGNN